ncbi:hypothetical protein ACFL1G_04600 [Planctomycetota bacterium]
MSSSEFEICSNCKREILPSEPVCVFNGSIVCAECDGKLRIRIDAGVENVKKGDFLIHETTVLEDKNNIADEDINEILGLEEKEFRPLETNIERAKSANEVLTTKLDESEFEDALCFFCQKNKTQKSSVCVAPMFKMVTIKCSGFFVNKKLFYYTREENVPRCERCKSYHDHRKEWLSKCILIGLVVFGVIGILIGLFAVSNLTANHGFGIHYLILIPLFAIAIGQFGLIFGLIFYFLFKPRLAKGIHPERHLKKFINIKNALAQKWKSGEKPNEKLKAIHIPKTLIQIEGISSQDLIKCSICRKGFSKDDILYTSRGFNCEVCMQQRKLAEKVQEIRLGLIFAGLGLYSLGIVLLVVAVFIFLGELSIFGTAMAGGVIALSVVVFKLGTEAFRSKKG